VVDVEALQLVSEEQVEIVEGAEVMRTGDDNVVKNASKVVV
jgi:hypothetical protein